MWRTGCEDRSGDGRIAVEWLSELETELAAIAVVLIGRKLQKLSSPAYQCFANLQISCSVISDFPTSAFLDVVLNDGYRRGPEILIPHQQFGDFLNRSLVGESFSNFV